MFLFWVQPLPLLSVPLFSKQTAFCNTCKFPPSLVQGEWHFCLCFIFSRLTTFWNTRTLPSLLPNSRRARQIDPVGHRGCVQVFCSLKFNISPRDSSQIRCLASQLSPGNFKWIVDVFCAATAEAYSCFLFDVCLPRRRRVSRSRRTCCRQALSTSFCPAPIRLPAPRTAKGLD